jgi:hypothetical protein
MTWWQHLLLDSGLSVAFIWSVILAIRYRKQNKQLKDIEVKKSENEADTKAVDLQKAKIELGELFVEKSAEMFQQMQKLQEETYKATMKNGTDNADIIKQLNAVVEEQKRQSDELKRQGDELQRLSEGQEHMVSFLNGKYQSFLEENGFSKPASRYAAAAATADAPKKRAVRKTLAKEPATKSRKSTKTKADAK